MSISIEWAPKICVSVCLGVCYQWLNDIDAKNYEIIENSIKCDVKAAPAWFLLYQFTLGCLF